MSALPLMKANKEKSVKEQDIYKDLYRKMVKVFGDSVQTGSPEKNTILNMVGNLADKRGVESVTEAQLEGIKELLSGENETTHHMTFS